jgi:hypothetical protein
MAPMSMYGQMALVEVPSAVTAALLLRHPEGDAPTSLHSKVLQVRVAGIVVPLRRKSISLSACWGLVTSVSIGGNACICFEHWDNHTWVSVSCGRRGSGQQSLSFVDWVS